MKHHRRALSIILAALTALTLFSGCAKQEEPADQPEVPSTPEKVYTIGVIQYAEHPALDAACQGFYDGLAAAGYVADEGVTYDFQNAQGDPNNLMTIGQRFVAANVDMILAIATPAAQAVASQTETIPIVVTAVTDLVDAKLVASNEAPGGNVTGTTDLNPVDQQIELMLSLDPEVKTIGVLYTSNEDNSILQANMVKAYCETLGIEVVEGTVTSGNDVQQVAQSLTGKIDGLYVPTDNIIATAMPIVGEIMKEAKIPVICGESNMVESGGLATLGINYYNLGYQTGEIAARILNGEAAPAEMPVESQKDFDYAINGTVAEAIGVAIPEELKEFVIYPEN
ncbi:MAG TPA: ABC transporter substrate-binding protein [Terriglobales bacterium]|nr:ABC transporter substrate-binding protein [Terriglobales bacterium]